MSDGSEERLQTKMFWSISTKTRTYTSVNTCKGSLSCKVGIKTNLFRCA